MPLWYMKLEVLFVILFPLIAYARKYLPVLLVLGLSAAVACTFLEPTEKLYFSLPTVCGNSWRAAMQPVSIRRSVRASSEGALSYSF